MKPMLFHEKGPCQHCGIRQTPCWRRGPPEKPHLCNACGSRWLAKKDLTGYQPGKRTPCTPSIQADEESSIRRQGSLQSFSGSDPCFGRVPTKKRKVRSLDGGEGSRLQEASLRSSAFRPWGTVTMVDASTQTEAQPTMSVIVVQPSFPQYGLGERLPSGLGGNLELVECLSRTTSFSKEGVSTVYRTGSGPGGPRWSSDGNGDDVPCPSLFKGPHTSTRPSPTEGTPCVSPEGSPLWISPGRPSGRPSRPLHRLSADGTADKDGSAPRPTLFKTKSNPHPVLFH